MKAYAIVIQGNKVSESALANLIRSSDFHGNEFHINVYDAVTPNLVDSMMEEKQLKWNYPWEGAILDFNVGLIKSAYATTNPKARIACALSHYDLWERCVRDDEPYLIPEHDAEFVMKLELSVVEEFMKFPGSILSINSPLGATRRAALYHSLLRQAPGKFVPCPTIDDDKVPQGLPGNSAYIIKPQAAQAMIDLVANFGLWPNDAIMCKQLIHGLHCSADYYTVVQGTRSTTSL